MYGKIINETQNALVIDQKKPINQTGNIYLICFSKFISFSLNKRYRSSRTQKYLNGPVLGTEAELSKLGPAETTNNIDQVNKNAMRYHAKFLLFQIILNKIKDMIKVSVEFNIYIFIHAL